MRSHIIISTRPTTRKGSADGHQEETTIRPGWKPDAMNAANYTKVRADRPKLPSYNDPHMASATYAGIETTGRPFMEDARAGDADVKHTHGGGREGERGG